VKGTCSARRAVEGNTERSGPVAGRVCGVRRDRRWTGGSGGMLGTCQVLRAMGMSSAGHANVTGEHGL
jgi:hypothetical protein